MPFVANPSLKLTTEPPSRAILTIYLHKEDAVNEKVFLLYHNNDPGDALINYLQSSKFSDHDTGI